MKEKAYRIGQVIKQGATSCGWLRLVPVDMVMFEYIEVEYEDGSRKYFYENEKEFEHFESNFVSKRFTSYHEFFTTDKLDVEKRGSLQLKYYVRRDSSDYEIVKLSEKKSELAKLEENGLISHIKNRVTMYGHYDVNVNDHWDEDVQF